SAALISLSVPSTPTRRTLTRTPRPSGISSRDGLSSCARWTLPGTPGRTASAFIGVALGTNSVMEAVWDFMKLSFRGVNQRAGGNAGRRRPSLQNGLSRNATVTLCHELSLLERD